MEIIIHANASHSSRLIEYFQETYQGCKVKDSFELNEDILLFIQQNDQDNESFAIVQQLYEDNLIRWYIHSFFLTFSEYSNLDFLDTVQFSPGTYKLQLFPSKNITKQQILQKLHDRGVLLHPKQYDFVINVVHARGRYHFGVIPKAEFYDADKKIQVHQLASEEVSRASHKIQESLHRFNVHLPPDARVLDLGACPGGISLHLCQHVVPQGTVVGVDPGNLGIDPPHNFVFLKMEALDATSQLATMLPFDMIVCDILGSEFMATLNILQQLVPFLKVGGKLIWTIKLSRRGENSPSISSHLQKVTTAFRAKFHMFQDVQVKWLLANKNERTLCATKFM